MMRRESKVGFLVDFGEPKARLSVSGLDFVNPLLNQISALDSRLSTLGSRLSKLSELSSKPWGWMMKLKLRMESTADESRETLTSKLSNTNSGL